MSTPSASRSHLRQFLTLAGSAILLLVSSAACEEKSKAPQKPPSQLDVAQAAPTGTEPQAPAPGPTATADAGSAEPPPRPPWDGPFLVITQGSAGIYSEPSLARKLKIGYVQQGGRVPVKPEKHAGKNCRGGFYELVDGGYACSKHGTIDADDPRAKNGPKQPAFDDILPYRYARNTKHGAPLYKSVPTKEQVKKYETDAFERLEKDKAAKKNEEARKAKAKAKAKAEAARKAALPDVPRDDAARRHQAMKDGMRRRMGLPLEKPEKAESPSNAPDAGAPDWFQTEDANLHEITDKVLTADSDGVLAQRLMKGFYLAVSRAFSWGGRRYYQTTKGFTAPAKYFHLVNGSDFKGIELDETWELPIGWVLTWKKSKPKYDVDPETKQVKRAGSIKRHVAVNLTNEEVKIGKATYVKAVEGFWMRTSHLNITRPGPMPDEIKPGEVWLDINLSTQTLIAFRGNRPFYATLISSGKKHRDKKKDHSTPLGQWRVREKHVAATMDGDGSASDLPYSIEGVPYVMYFHKSYATHAAFWHRNYGTRMSHGCINMAPLDAKYMFFHTEPPVAEGWYGAWSSDERPGSLVVVHE